VTYQGKSVDAEASQPIQNWMTPPKIFAALDAEFGFAADLFADDSNTFFPGDRSRYFTKERSAFDHPWKFDYPVFGNPEYGRGSIDAVLDYAFEQVRVEKNLPAVVLLLPLTTPKWFSLAMRHAEVQVFEGRIAFQRPPDPVGVPAAKRKPSGSNFSNCLVIIRPVEDLIRGVSALRCSKTGVVTHDYYAGEPE